MEKIEINGSYLSDDVAKKIRESFLSNNDLRLVKLRNFLSQRSCKNLAGEIRKARFRKESIPIFYSFSASAMTTEFKKFFSSKILPGFIQKIIGKRVKGIEAKICRFSWKDYTIIDDRTVEGAGFDFIFDLTDSWDENFGGSVVYVDGTGNSISIPHSLNSLAIVERADNIQKFVKYCNHYSKGRNRDLIIGKIII